MNGDVGISPGTSQHLFFLLRISGLLTSHLMAQNDLARSKNGVYLLENTVNVGHFSRFTLMKTYPSRPRIS